MGACSVASVEELTRALLGQRDAACVCIERGASDDVAPALLAKASQIRESGKTVRIVCPDRVSAERYRTLLAGWPLLESDSVATVRQLALETLAVPRIRDAVGRDARMIDENEHDVLMEDVKVSGVKPGRLREMLGFFYKSMSSCADEDEGWLITAEEKAVHAILIENLEARRAVLPCEASSLAYRGLKAADVEMEPMALLADDFGSLSKASQRLVRCLSTEGFVAVGSGTAAWNSEERYPNFEGFDELVDACDEHIALAAEAHALPVDFVSLENPQEEFTSIAASVAKDVRDGVDPADILIAVPNSTWGFCIEDALERCGVACFRERGSMKVKGDPRTEGRFADLKLAAFLRLYLDGDDVTALRSWLGFGDWLLRSDAFLELVNYAKERGITVSEALFSLRAVPDAERPTKTFWKFDAAFDELDELADACRSIGCDEVKALFDAHGMALSSDQVELLGDDPAHADIGRLARHAFDSAAIEGEAGDAVTIAPYRHCHGRTARITYVTGLVNGFLPSLDAVDDKYTVDHRRVALARERLLFLDLLTTASGKVRCSRFEQDRLENATALRMQTSRVYVKDGMRYATVAPSEFIGAPLDVLVADSDVPTDLPTKVLCASTTL